MKHQLLFHIWVFSVASVAADELDEDQIEQLLAAHNSYRSMEGGSAMNMLEWDATLARLALQWAELCGDPKELDPHSYFWGQYLGRRKPINEPEDVRNLVEEAPHSWFSDKRFYDYDNNTCKPDAATKCHNYIQLVWDINSRVGCGGANCSREDGNDTYHYHSFVCFYWPGANFPAPSPYSAEMPRQRPYVRGKACSQCVGDYKTCQDGLCTQEEYSQCAPDNCTCNAECFNGGTVGADCKCYCARGYRGDDCAMKCVDINETFCYMNRFSCYWNQHSEDNIYDHCPMTCKRCEGGYIGLVFGATTQATNETYVDVEQISFSPSVHCVIRSFNFMFTVLVIMFHVK